MKEKLAASTKKALREGAALIRSMQEEIVRLRGKERLYTEKIASLSRQHEEELIAAKLDAGGFFQPGLSDTEKRRLVRDNRDEYDRLLRPPQGRLSTEAAPSVSPEEELNMSVLNIAQDY